MAQFRRPDLLIVLTDGEPAYTYFDGVKIIPGISDERRTR